MTIIDVENFVGANFDMPDDEGNLHDTTVTEAIKNHTKDFQEDSVQTQFCEPMNKDNHESILNLNESLDHIERKGEDPVHWELHHMGSHQGPLSDEHPFHKGSPQVHMNPF